MTCASCGSKIRKLAKQYQYMTVEPLIKNTEETKKRLAELAKYSIVVEEESENTITVSDYSNIHTV